MTFDADGYAADSLANQQEAMAGPLETAMRSDMLSIGTGGRIRLDASHWEPMIQIAPARDLAEETLVVSGIIVGAAGPLPPVTFERYSEHHGFLTLHVPAPLAGRRTTAPIDIDLQARLNGRVLNLTELRALVVVRVVEGSFARLLHVVSVEHMRLRRQARLLHRAATLDGARGFMLDRYGQELGVPRLSDRLVARRGEIITELTADPENDASYRRRLAIYRPWFAPGRQSVLDALNGTAADGGPLQQIGAPAKFTLLEDDNPLYSAMRIVSVAVTVAAADAQRARFFAYLRESTLIDPTVAVPGGRSMPQNARTQQNALRRRLRDALTFSDPTKRSMAPHLALAFDRLIGFVRACGATDSITVRRAQDDAGGNRLELGLAAEVDGLPAAMLAAVRGVVTTAARRAALSPEHQAVAAQVARMDTTNASGDWLFRALGFRTAEMVGAGRIIVSHLSMGGLTVEGPATGTMTEATAGLRYAARMSADAAGLGIALAYALGGGADGWPGGLPPWTVEPMAQVQTNLEGLKECDPALVAAMAQNFTITPPAADLGRFVEAAKRYPPGTIAVLTLDPAFANGLLIGDRRTLARWADIAETLGTNGAAALALFSTSAGQTLMVVSAHGLPLIGSNVGARRSTGYYWDLMPVSAGAVGQCSPSGTESVLRTTVPGIYAIHCLASARIGATDPFEYRVDLPAGEILDITQYEMLMNILGRCYPVGIEVNSWNLRRRHVVLDTANPVPLTPHQSRSFRRWQDLRFVGVDLSPPVS
jgi:hypothetical protein